MPWSNDKFQSKIEHYRANIEAFLGIMPDALVFLCTRDEMTARVKTELLQRGTSADKLAFLEMHVFSLLLGKYFASKNEIWLIEGKGDIDAILVHELLHSVQKCNPKRENICDYLTYRITNDPTIMEEKLRSEWAEIERVHGLDQIKSRFLADGNCEDF
ncbi:MAG TPA: hypothetical protein VKM55_01685 [Candidatus Lokiarchaeia archaeon]|nr:hypothetical protein [Candidatus Lokiarchaeia archaeon]